MNRRQFIGSSAIIGTGTIAGCLDYFSDSYATLQVLELLNRRDEPVTMELKIELDDTDEIVHEDAYEIGARDAASPDCVWPDEPLRILARNAEDEEWNDFSTADGDGCSILIATITPNGSSFFNSFEECPTPSPSCHTDVEG